MRTIEPQELKNILEKHRKWVMGEGGERADLSGADLSGADLSGAKFEDIIADLYKVLDLAKPGVPALYRSIWDGKIAGSAYQGECACLVGTIANARRQSYQKLDGLVPNPTRPAERWFLGISRGDMPQNSQISKLTAEWVEAYMVKEGITVPKRQVVWS